MSLLKRVTATFTGTLEQAVSRIENHDAVVAAALRDARGAAAKAKVRLARVQQDGTRLEKRCNELQQTADQWTQRARDAAAEDEDKAIECLQRHNQTKQQGELAKQQLAEHRARETNLNKAVQRIDERILELETSRNVLRSRQSSAEAAHAVSQPAVAECAELDDVLERWEMKVLAAEYATSMPGENAGHAETDVLETEYADIENRQLLKAQLEELLNPRNSLGDEGRLS